jgi:hypothetical protein
MLFLALRPQFTIPTAKNGGRKRVCTPSRTQKSPLSDRIPTVGCQNVLSDAVLSGTINNKAHSNSTFT